jgi:hypothetical protein
MLEGRGGPERALPSDLESRVAELEDRLSNLKWVFVLLVFVVMGLAVLVWRSAQ